MKILMVCLGNICRSPLAEGILRSKISEVHTVASAGTIGLHAGEAPDRRSQNIAAAYGLDISAQCAQQFRVRFFDEFNKIFCMDHNNLKDVLALARTGEDREKVSLLLEEAGDSNVLEVPDPYFGGEDGFVKVYHMLDKACEAIAEKYRLKF